MDDILKTAREQFRDSDDGTSYNRKTAHEDIHFARLSDQWPENIKKQREQEGRPCLTINKLPAFIRQVVNDSRQNKPSMSIHPVDNGADEDTAEVIGGLIRSIERHSHADIAYDTAIDHAVSGGFGFFKIGIDYAHDDSFNIEARIERVPNPLMVHWDPNSVEFDSSDWNYAFVSDLLGRKEFDARFPKAKPVSFENDANNSDYNDWMEGEERVRIAEYWMREEKTRKLLMLSDGTVIREDAFKDEAKAIAEAMGVAVQREREVKYHDVTRRLISGVEELEEAEPWPGSTIPICPVWGDEVMLDGRRYFRSMVRDARDPQTMFNFWRSATTELVALAPRAPWVGPKGFVPDDQRAKWETANSRSHAYLEYDPSSPRPPERQAFAGVPAGALQEALNASDDMKAIIGIYDTSLGARSNETSGRAIMARQREADVSNFHFIDNLSRAIEGAGKILVEIIPHVYTARDTIRILGEDMAEKVVRLSTDNAGPVMDEETGERLLYDLSVGKYDVDVKTGPSYGTQREETREMLIEIMRAVPDAARYIGDILMDYMDFQGADVVAKRLKMLLPPQIQQAEGLPVSQPMQQPMQPNPGTPPGQPPMQPPQGEQQGF